MTTLVMRPTEAQYRAAWELEREQQYPAVDAFEQARGYAVPRGRLEGAARVLACPVKANPPNWQHGRVVYAAVRAYLAAQPEGPIALLDIGTAKGFSALVMQWALNDAGVDGHVTSVDVIDPRMAVLRNTVADVDGPVTLRQTIGPWQESEAITFLRSTGVQWLEQSSDRIHVAFVDGKHTGTVVRREGVLLAARQQSGDLAIFDDVHIPDVSVAVASLHAEYKFEYLRVLANREYAIGVRR